MPSKDDHLVNSRIANISNLSKSRLHLLLLLDTEEGTIIEEIIRYSRGGEDNCWVRHIYRSHGWPGLEYRRDECMEAIIEYKATRNGLGKKRITRGFDPLGWVTMTMDVGLSLRDELMSRP